MAQGAAGPFRALVHAPGNPQLPVLPGPLDPKTGLADPFTSGAGINAPRFESSYLEVLAGGPNIARGFAQTWLNGIGGAPNPVDFGDITAAKQRTVGVHNTYRNPVTVTAVDVSGVSGVTMLSPGLPVVLAAFSSQVFTFEATLAGDPTFDALVTFTHSEGSFTIRFIGRRVIIFNAIPQRPIAEQITFGTDIMDSHDGSEQAMAWRTTPRSIVQYDIRHTDDEERAALINQILGAGQLLHGVPLWFEARQVSAAAASVDITVQVPTVGMELLPGDTVSFVLPDKTTAEGEVLSLTASAITFTAAIGLALPLRTFVMPIRFGWQENQVAVATFPTAAEDLRVKFTLIEYDNIGAVDPAYFDAHPFDGLPIPKAPLFFDGQSRGGSIRSDATRLDGRTGQITQARSQVIARPGQPVVVHLEDFAAMDAWRKFLHSIRGSWGLFYVPTGTNDLPVVPSGLALGSNNFDVPNIGLTSLGNHAPRRDVRVTVPGGSYDRRITALADNGATENVTLDDTIPGVGTVLPENVKIEWLTLSRLVGDSATMKHTTLGVAELRFSIRGVIIL